MFRVIAIAIVLAVVAASAMVTVAWQRQGGDILGPAPKETAQTTPAVSPPETEAAVSESRQQTAPATAPAPQADEENGLGTEGIAAALAEEFQDLGVDQQAVLDLHDQDIGFGAIFHLYTLARASGQSVDDLLAGAPVEQGKRQFRFGELRKELREAGVEIVAAGAPQNLGQLVSQAAKMKHGQGAE